jgi:hypothetical protein
MYVSPAMINESPRMVKKATEAGQKSNVSCDSLMMHHIHEITRSYPDTTRINVMSNEHLRHIAFSISRNEAPSETCVWVFIRVDMIALSFGYGA